MRLFIAVHLPPDVIEELDALARPAIDGVRWTTRDQWHVTLRFLGEMDDAVAVAVVDVLHATRLAECTATIGPRSAMLGRGVVQLPVVGLDALATAVIDATRDFGDAPPERPFRGHLTLARTKTRKAPADSFVLVRSWTVREIALVRSHLGRGGARYETIETFALRGI